ncbi:hypothetical protein [Sphingomonas kyeonggiensis]|uniref:Uncharacterized protein n=1 Tax=Sphingomonas kyeonggiensis TaxID=1268553 RepID=A0A7W6JU53_9SPHN|nr:hypothetical protein [Sphingomonas kyeonggiensis]MBB4099521.1 hypothetical protein [Sphingomonas kyeonggiensis]
MIQPAQAKPEFLLAHYQQLFDRNEKAQQTRWQFIQLSLAALAAFYAAILGDKLIPDGPAKMLVGILPIWLSFLGRAHAMSQRNGMIERGEVMRSIERKFGAVGWQLNRRMKRERAIKSYIEEHPGANRESAEANVRHISDGQYGVSRLYWKIAIGVTAAIEVYFFLVWVFPNIFKG